MLQERDLDFEVGFVLSILGHGTIAALIFFGILAGPQRFDLPKVYSVTTEGGPKLGGISQVEEKKDTQIAPPKNVQAAPEQSKPEPPKAEPVKEEKAVEPVKKVEDAEISTAEKVKPVKEEVKKVEPKAVAKTEVKKEEKKVVKEKPIVKDPNADVNKKLEQAMQRYLGESSNAGGKGFGAGAVGAKGMGGGELMPGTAMRYLKLVEDRTKSGWHWPSKLGNPLAQVTFEISPQGVISKVMIVKSSGNSEFDASVERAINSASPLPPPPIEVYQKYIRSIRMTFDPRAL